MITEYSLPIEFIITEFDCIIYIWGKSKSNFTSFQEPILQKQYCLCKDRNSSTLQVSVLFQITCNSFQEDASDENGPFIERVHVFPDSVSGGNVEWFPENTDAKVSLDQKGIYQEVWRKKSELNDRENFTGKDWQVQW